MILVFNNGTFTNNDIEDWIGNFPLLVCDPHTVVKRLLVPDMRSATSSCIQLLNSKQLLAQSVLWLNMSLHVL